jgi:uncharacterized protein YecT (DUF1311 family)
MIATLHIALAVLAVQAPSAQDCRDPQNQSDMNICAAIAFERADAELNAEYRGAIAHARAADREAAGYLTEGDDRPGDEASLREAQRAWVAFRDAHCRLQGYEARGGSMEPMLYDGCRATLTRERIAQLRPTPLGN